MIYFFYKVYKGKLLRVDHFIAGDEEEPARKQTVEIKAISKLRPRQHQPQVLLLGASLWPRGLWRVIRIYQSMKVIMSHHNK